MSDFSIRIYQYAWVCMLVLKGPAWRQPVQLQVSRVPFPVRHALEPPSKVSQLAMLEQRGARGLLRTPNKMGRTVHLHRNAFPILESHERIDAVPGGLAAMLFLDLDTVRADFSHHIGLQLRSRLSGRDESVTAGLA